MTGHDQQVKKMYMGHSMATPSPNWTEDNVNASRCNRHCLSLEHAYLGIMQEPH